MRAELEQLHGGELRFDQFLDATRVDWRLLSGYLVRRWSVPPCVDIEDVEQELLLACWEHVPRYDPTKGRDIKSYVVFNSCDRAKRWLHGQRAALRRRDGAPSRHPLAFSGITEDELTLVDYVVFTKPVQEQVVVEREALDHAFKRCRNERDHLCVVAIVEAMGDIERAADWLYDDFNTRRRCRFNCREDVRRAIRRTVYAVAA